MFHKLNTLRSDLYNVFVEGNANSLQMARVFAVIALPVLTIFMIGLHAVK